MGMHQVLTKLFNVGVQAVIGEKCVAHSLTRCGIEGPVSVLAIGKAADSMLRGALSALPTIESALMVTKHQHYLGGLESSNIEVMEAAHPIPDASSLLAGQRTLHWVRSHPQESTLLFLLSGGASSLAEVLRPGASLEELTDVNRLALSNGSPIEETNKARTEISAIKAGKLLSNFCGRHVEVLYISDVEGDNIETIGSGIGACPGDAAFSCNSRIVGSNQVARQAIVTEAHRAGFSVVENQELLFDDVGELAKRLARRVVEGPSGLYVWGGESTVCLPTNPGLGGRNQCLALRFAKEISAQQGIIALFAGTDGTDGPTANAGAIVDGETFTKSVGADEAIKAANSSAYLENCGAVLRTGPTGTNVMDLGLVFKKND